MAQTEVERRQRYIDKISNGSLKQLVISCLDDEKTSSNITGVWEDYQYNNR